MTVYQMDREDALGLKALEQEYAAPTIGQVLAARATDAEIVGLVKRRLLSLQRSNAVECIERMSTAEIAVLVTSERRDMAS